LDNHIAGADHESKIAEFFKRMDDKEVRSETLEFSDRESNKILIKKIKSQN
jgi:hypothetical protein